MSAGLNSVSLAVLIRGNLVFDPFAYCMHIVDRKGGQYGTIYEL